jgi:hypothetical protein
MSTNKQLNLALSDKKFQRRHFDGRAISPYEIPSLASPPRDGFAIIDTPINEILMFLTYLYNHDAKLSIDTCHVFYEEIPNHRSGLRNQFSSCKKVNALSWGRVRISDLLELIQCA